MIIEVIAKTNKKKSSILQIGQNKYEVSVRSNREKGKANEEIIRLLSDELHIPFSCFKIKSGHTSSRKIILVE